MGDSCLIVMSRSEPAFSDCRASHNILLPVRAGVQSLMSLDTPTPQTIRTQARTAGGLAGLLAIAAAGISALILIGGLSRQDPFESIIPLDKTRHLLAFAALGLCAGLSPRRWLHILLIGSGIGLAGMLEWAQDVLTTTRTSSLGDFQASCLGLFAGAGAGSFLLNFFGVAAASIRGNSLRDGR